MGLESKEEGKFLSGHREERTHRAARSPRTMTSVCRYITRATNGGSTGARSVMALTREDAAEMAPCGSRRFISAIHLGAHATAYLNGDT